jgi:hypothetical protein
MPFGQGKVTDGGWSPICGGAVQGQLVYNRMLGALALPPLQIFDSEVHFIMQSLLWNPYGLGTIFSEFKQHFLLRRRRNAMWIFGSKTTSFQ